jgi:hypothetical protein
MILDAPAALKREATELDGSFPGESRTSAFKRDGPDVLVRLTADIATDRNILLITANPIENGRGCPETSVFGKEMKQFFVENELDSVRKDRLLFRQHKFSAN